MKVIVTCGPSFEPIDRARRLTNFSTGQLGILLTDRLAREGFEVFCLKGSGATCPGPGERAHLSLFDTNDDLLGLLKELADSERIAAVFHAAALCDYKVKSVHDAQGHDCRSAKIASRAGSLSLVLEPATKVISQLRALFPEAVAVGWKYELEGTVQDALSRTRRQLIENKTDACVLNGEAYGPGFALCEPSFSQLEFRHKGELVEGLTGWLSRKLRSGDVARTRGIASAACADEGLVRS
jgi:phosphopantothenoylcysteine decarboxylase/phosphopantothenate--cysteine ligase